MITDDHGGELCCVAPCLPVALPVHPGMCVLQLHTGSLRLSAAGIKQLCHSLIVAARLRCGNGLQATHRCTRTTVVCTTTAGPSGPSGPTNTARHCVGCLACQ